MKEIKITSNLTMIDEDHLGGFIIENDPATFTPTLWKFICEKYEIKSVIDVGCGMGYALKEFSKYCEDFLGVDGSEYVQKNSDFKNHITHFDFSLSKYETDKKYDLAWSSEFVEHVDESFIENYFSIFENSKYVAITYADIDQDGHHHVNCKPKEYWINLFEKKDFEFLDLDTETLKNEAFKDALTYNPTYRDNHFYNRGLFFKNKKN